MNYTFDENTPPKEIIVFALSEIAETMKEDGFTFLKSTLTIVKKTKEFRFKVSAQGGRYNSKGVSVRMNLNASVMDTKKDKCYWGHRFAFSNAKQDDVFYWELYDKDNYERSMNDIKHIVMSHLLPFFRRFDDVPNFVGEVAEKGFCVFGETQVYDAAYHIPIEFLAEYGTKQQMEMAFQQYIDRHELHYVKPNMKNAITLLKEGKEVVNNGEQHYAEYAVEHDLKLVL